MRLWALGHMVVVKKLELIAGFSVVVGIILTILTINLFS